MSFFTDMRRETMVAAGEHVRAVGWLHPGHPFARGEVPAGFLARLKEFARLSGESADALYFGAFGGFHTCEFCGQAHGIQNFGVPNGRRRGSGVEPIDELDPGTLNSIFKQAGLK